MRDIMVTHGAKPPKPRGEPEPPSLESLVDYARLAPSTRNTQPWSFSVQGDEIRVFVDRERWLRVADPDQRELYLSVGCALENLLVAGAHYGYKASVSYVKEDRADGLAAVARFEPGGRAEDRRVPLFGAIGRRQTNRRPYHRRPLARDVMAGLYAAVYDEDVELWLFTDAETSGRVERLLELAERTQYSDPAYRRELAESIGNGVFGHGWFESAAGRLVVKHVDVGGAAARKGVARLHSAPALGVLTSRADSRAVQVRAGQAFERLALTATRMGVALQPMSALMQSPMTRAAVAELLPVEVYPQHAFRLGYAPPERRRSPRRPAAGFLRPPKKGYDS
jgi:nitroreductase